VRISPSRAFGAFKTLSVIIVTATVITAVACNDVAREGDVTATDAVSAAPPSAPADQEDQAMRRGFEVAQSRQLKASPAANPAPQTAQLPDPSGMIIRNGHVVVEVDSLEAAIERVRAMALALGGSVGNVSMSTGDKELRSATLEMKIPSARFDDAMTGMSPLGKVEQSTATAQDVGEEFVDISARLANARRLERRLIDLLATRTGKLEDVLAVERELARVREEIERYEGRIRYLGSRVATSSIVASLHEKAPIVASPGTNVLGNAFLNMWRNFVRFIAGLIEALGVIIPVAAMGVAGYFAWKRWTSDGSRPAAVK
jgi:hypothetical protein